MSHFHTDSPITGETDAPDLLNREEFAERVGGGLLLREGAPGLVVSIEGEWGYGKTSFINLLIKHFESLSDDEQPIVFNFCPWMISGVENLVQEFLVQFAATIGSTDNAGQAKNAARQLVSYSKVFSVLKFVPGAEPWASIVQGVMGSVGEAASSVGKLKELNIERRRDKVVEALGKLNKPIVVFIDDIDRIPPEEIYDVIRLVKSVADFPRVAFVLALDSSYVVESLENYEISDGAHYLDKIIQTRIHLPLASSKDIEKIVNNEFAQLPNETRQEYFKGGNDRLGILYQSSIKYLLATPRDVKRLFNRIKLIEPVVRGEVEFADLFALEVVGIKAPKVYVHIKENPGAYTGVPNDTGFMIDEPSDYVASKLSVREKALEGFPEHLKSPLKVLMHKLFPLLKESSHSHGQNYYTKKGRIAAADRLMIIHTYGLPKGEVSLAVSKAYLSAPEKREEILKRVMNEQDIDGFLDGVSLAITEEKPKNPESFIKLLSEILEDQLISKLSLRSIGFFDVDIKHKIWRIFKHYLNPLNKKSIIAVIRDLIKDPARLSLGTYGLRHCLGQDGLFSEEGTVPEGQKWCSGEELTQIKSEWIECVCRSFDSGVYCSLSAKSAILFMLYRIDPELAKKLYAPMLEDNAGLDCIAEAIGSFGVDTQNGQYVSVDQEVLEALFEVASIKGKVSEVLSSDRKLERHLRAVYLSIQSGKSIYLNDYTQADNF